MESTTSEPAHETDAPEERLVGAERVIAVLTELADHPLGVTLDVLAGAVRGSKPTVHRALATLRRSGLAEMTGRGVYILGDEYLRLAFRNFDGRPETARIQPLLEELAAQYRETAHYAVLSGRDIVYRAKMDPQQGAMRLTSVIGGRNPAYRTGVGKALLSDSLFDVSQIINWFGTFPLEPKTPHTLITPHALDEELAETRQRGFGVDNQENELGVNCVAIPIHLDGGPIASGAVSVSAVSFRCPIDQLIQAVPDIRDTISHHLGANALRGWRSQSRTYIYALVLARFSSLTESTCGLSFSAQTW